MNLVQIMRRSRQGVDALLPASGASSMWPDEEMVDLVNEAYETTMRRFRLVHSKWGLTTVNTSSSAYTREEETYTPSTALVVSTTQQKITLPPDFAEIIRIKCTNNTSIRIIPADSESYHWIDVEQAGLDNSGSITGTTPAGLTFYYDVIDQRTLFMTPPVSGSFNLEVDYVPMRRPLYLSNAGTLAVTNASTTLTGTSTTWSDDLIYTSASGQQAELIVGTKDPQSNIIRVDRDYPRVATVTSNTAAVLSNVYGGTTVTSGAPAILTMVPVLPREYHRWVSRIASSLMLSKINPELAEKYAARFMTQFIETIQPAIRIRQSQDSRVVEDSDEFSGSH